MCHSGMSTDKVINLITIKPIGENETQIKSIYQEKLTALRKKINL
jgi:hypothetical protein